MPKPIVTIVSVQERWMISWWKYNGSYLTDSRTYSDIKTAELAARAFADANKMAYLEPGESFLSVEKRPNGGWGLAEVFFNEKPKWYGITRSTKEIVLKEGVAVSMAAKKNFLPDFLL